MVGLPLNGRQPSQLILLSGPAVDNGGSGALIGSQRQYPSAVAISVAGGTGNSTLYSGRRRLQQRSAEQHRSADAVSGRAAGVQGRERRAAGTLRRLHGRHGECGHPIGQQHVSRNRLRLRPPSQFQLARLLRHRRRRTRPRADRRDDWRPHRPRTSSSSSPALQITNERIRPTSADTFVPTAKMLAGDFTDVMSAQCQGGVNRTLGGPFVGNKVDPVAVQSDRAEDRAPAADDQHRRAAAAPASPCRTTATKSRPFCAPTIRSRARTGSSPATTSANYDRQPSHDGTNVLMATGSGLGLDNRVQTIAVGHDWVLSSNLIAATRFRTRDPGSCGCRATRCRPGATSAPTSTRTRTSRDRTSTTSTSRTVGHARVPGQVHFNDAAVLGRHRLGARRPQRVFRRDVDSPVRGRRRSVPGERHLSRSTALAPGRDGAGSPRMADFLRRPPELVQPGRQPDRGREDELTSAVRAGCLAHQQPLYPERRPPLGTLPRARRTRTASRRTSTWTGSIRIVTAPCIRMRPPGCCLPATTASRTTAPTTRIAITS